MKKIILASFMFVTGALSVLAQEESVDLKVMNLLTLSSAELEAILNQENENAVIEFPVGSIIPLKFFLKGGLISLVGGEKEIGQMKIEKTLYVRLFKEEGFSVSSDLIEWKPFLEFITGDLSVTLDVEGEVPSITLSAEFNERG